MEVQSYKVKGSSQNALGWISLRLQTPRRHFQILMFVEGDGARGKNWPRFLPLKLCSNEWEEQDRVEKPDPYIKQKKNKCCPYWKGNGGTEGWRTDVHCLPPLWCSGWTQHPLWTFLHVGSLNQATSEEHTPNFLLDLKRNVWDCSFLSLEHSNPACSSFSFTIEANTSILHPLPRMVLKGRGKIRLHNAVSFPTKYWALHPL